VLGNTPDRTTSDYGCVHFQKQMFSRRWNKTITQLGSFGIMHMADFGMQMTGHIRSTSS
jgi:hypothetical protein